MRILTLTLGMCLILNVPTQDRMSRDMLAISAACRLPLRVGTPDATMYASPMVSTCQSKKCKRDEEHNATLQDIWPFFC